MSRRRVVVTGMGALTPLANSVEATWQGILAGKSGIGPIEHMDVSAYSTKFGGTIKDFEVADYMSPKEARKMDVFIQYGMAAGFRQSRIPVLNVPSKMPAVSVLLWVPALVA